MSQPRGDEVDPSAFQVSWGDGEAAPAEKKANSSIAAQQCKDDGNNRTNNRQEHQVNPDCTLLVSNLPFECTSQALHDTFAQLGKVVRASIAYSPEGQSRGMGLVEFSSRRDAETGIEEFDGIEMAGRPMRVRFVQLGAQEEVDLSEFEEQRVDDDHDNFHAGRCSYEHDDDDDDDDDEEDEEEEEEEEESQEEEDDDNAPLTADC
jgi:RNA recognition motif-containing protein